MFTGIIECTGSVVDLTPSKTNLNITIHSRLTEELQIDQSISHNGICLTVVDVLLREESYMVTAIGETLEKTNLRDLCINDQVNLERSMLVNGRLDGHIVQGHVDQVAVCASVDDQDGSWLYGFEYEEKDGCLLVDKGSVCVNGVSLTVVKSLPGFFTVAVIPYTWQYTNFNRIRQGSRVNIEYDIIGKYVAKMVNRN